MDFRGATAARAPDRLRPLPPFAPAAERCAFTCATIIDARPDVDQSRTVEAEFARNIARSCNLLEQALPKPALRPSVVAIVDRGRRTIFGRPLTHKCVLGGRLAISAMPRKTTRRPLQSHMSQRANGGRRSERQAGAPAHRPGDEVEHTNLPCRTDPRAQEARISSGAAVTEMPRHDDVAADRAAFQDLNEASGAWQHPLTLAGVPVRERGVSPCRPRLSASCPSPRGSSCDSAT